LLEYIENGGT